MKEHRIVRTNILNGLKIAGLIVLLMHGLIPVTGHAGDHDSSENCCHATGSSCSIVIINQVASAIQLSNSFDFASSHCFTESYFLIETPPPRITS